MTLDIGPGPNVQPHFDQPVVRADRRMVGRGGGVGFSHTITSDARELPFKTSAFSTVYCSHILEHFRAAEAAVALREWWRVVAPGGELQVFVPNAEWWAVQVLNNIVDGPVWHAVYGRQEYELDVHRSGWTPSLLRSLLESLPGVASVFLRTFRNSICAWVAKCA